MPGQTFKQLYDIEPLVPLVQSGFTLLTPNIRLARRIKQEWDLWQQSRGKSTWDPVPVFALEAWLERRWLAARRAGRVASRSLLDTLRAHELWLEIIQDERLGAGEYNLLQPAAAAELAARARDQLLRWRVDVAQAGVRSRFTADPDCTTYLNWLQTFDRRLDKAGLATLSDAVTELCNVSGSLRWPATALVDFDDIPPLYRATLQRHSPEIREVRTAGSTAAGECRAFDDKALELEAAAQWACRQHREQPENRVGVVLADMSGDRPEFEYRLRRAFDCLGENYHSLPVNFSSGITLDRAPVVRDALRMLRTAGSVMKLTDVVALLQSRFSAHAEGATELGVRFLTTLFDDGREQVETGRLRHLARTIALENRQGLTLGDCLYAVQAMRLGRLRQAPSDWIEPICQILDHWGWPGPGALDSLEYQQVERWYETLEQFASYDQVCSAMDLPTALQCLTRCCQGQISQPQTADSNIQVLGPLEAAGLQFDQLWLCGFQGSRWPQAPRPNPFIPLELQNLHDMPHANAEREWQYAANLMGQYRRSTSLLIASYCTQIDGVPELPSPLLADLPVAAANDPRSLPPEWLQLQAAGGMESIVDGAAPTVSDIEREALRGGSAILEDQSLCPFRAFARRRLGVESLSDYRVALTAADRGRILHDALYALWGRIDTSAELAAVDQGELIAVAVATALDAVPPGLRRLVGPVCLELEARRLGDLLQEWLEVERRRPPFRVIVREEQLEANVAGIPMTLRMDRVDQVESGERLIIDYKSSRNSLSHWFGERPSSPQLPLYGMVREGVSGLAFAEVRPRECRYLGIGDPALAGIQGVTTDLGKKLARYGPEDNWPAMLAAWGRNLENLALRFLQGEAAVAPQRGACDYCGLQPLCRVEIDPMEEHR